MRNSASKQMLKPLTFDLWPLTRDSPPLWPLRVLTHLHCSTFNLLLLPPNTAAAPIILVPVQRQISTIRIAVRLFTSTCEDQFGMRFSLLPCHLPNHDEFVISSSCKIFSTTRPSNTVHTCWKIIHLWFTVFHQTFTP